MKRLRVLFLASRDWYHPQTTGGDNTLWENARFLASRKHQVTYVAASFPGAEPRATIDGIHVVRLGGIHSLWLRTFVYYMSSCRGRYDVVVTEGFGGSRIPRLAPLYVKEPIITAWHQIHTELFAAQYPRYLLTPLNIFERTIAWVHRDTYVQAYTDEWKKAFPAIGFTPSKIFVLPVSIRDDWLSLSDGLKLVADPTILWVGKIRRYKCPDHVIRAMPALLKEIPNARLIIAGRRDDVRYERELSDLTAKLKLVERVDFRFDVSEDDKKRLFQMARVLVLPSSVEGFGIVVLEANACGVPVVASDGVPEGAVLDGVNGIRYRFGDVPGLSQALTHLLSSDELYSQLSRNSIDWARRFRWTKVGEQFESFVSHLSPST